MGPSKTNLGRLRFLKEDSTEEIMDKAECYVKREEIISGKRPMNAIDQNNGKLKSSITARTTSHNQYDRGEPSNLIETQNLLEDLHNIKSL